MRLTRCTGECQARKLDERTLDYLITVQALSGRADTVPSLAIN